MLQMMGKQLPHLLGALMPLGVAAAAAISDF